MPFSHHSHSGEFCAHASDKLEDVVLEAIRRQMQVFALTEHMPRDHDADLYPEEVCICSTNGRDLLKTDKMAARSFNDNPGSL